MKLLSIFHKNRIKNIPAVSKCSASLEEVAHVFKLTTEQITSGLNTRTASTGTPIPELSGGAKYNTIISNIGGGSKASGGGGMEAGLKVLSAHIKADTILKTAAQNKTSKKFLIK